MKGHAMSGAFVASIVCCTSCASVPTTRPVDTSTLEAARAALAGVNLSGNQTAAQVAAHQVSTLEVDDKQERKEQDEALDAAFGSMLAACQEVVSGFESSADRLRTVKVMVATVGAVAGSIAVPALTSASAAANAVWITSFGGISGVANAAQQALTEVGLTPSTVLQDRQNILADWKKATEAYFDPTSDNVDRSLAIQQGLTACTLYGITVPGNQSIPVEQSESDQQGDSDK